MLKRQSSHYLQRTHKPHLLYPCFCVGGLLGRTRPIEVTHTPYAPNRRLKPEPNGEFLLDLDAEIDPIPCGFIDPVPPAFTAEQKSVVQWNRTAFDFSLSNAVVNFLQNRINGDLYSERAFLSRNDHFLDIIRIIAAKGTEYAAMSITRDENTPSFRTGPDATIYEEGYPELVVVEEQAAGGVGAERELCDNFVFLPHYARLTRIVGIAITGNQFQIGFIYRDPNRFEVLMTLRAGQAGNGYTLIRAAVNIGLWFRATIDGGLLERVPFQFGVPSMNAHSQLTIFRHQFQKTLYEDDDINLEALSEFYKSIRSQPISYFECPVNDESKTDSVDLIADEVLVLVMEPVGLQRQPRSSDELKDCLVCILTALQDLHGRGYVHLDLRWPNVIIVEEGSWYIVDGEYVRKAGDPYPKNLRIRDGDVVDFAVDLTLLGKMLGALESPRLLTSNVQELIEYLTKGDRSKRTAKEALQLVQGWCVSMNKSPSLVLSTHPPSPWDSRSDGEESKSPALYRTALGIF